ncbi:MAG: hypothetical protein GWN10_26255, partial [Nitrospinaceae bacterium]|nr:hypothetical protein [Nitrospinaceae bacterium]NIW08931.1 hypothetical protein [Nitrospinaceae bacterium]NIW62118.1 hypothetical protein [Nitrospinaceae bacterium]NIX37533.1 hypothetical protein [Nitrospinaceae bacterium]
TSPNATGVYFADNPTLYNNGVISGRVEGVRLLNRTESNTIVVGNSNEGVIEGRTGARLVNSGASGFITLNNSGRITGSVFGAILENKDTVGTGYSYVGNLGGTIEATADNGVGIAVVAPNAEIINQNVLRTDGTNEWVEVATITGGNIGITATGNLSLNMIGGVIEGDSTAISMNAPGSDVSLTLDITAMSDPVTRHYSNIRGDIVGGTGTDDTVILRGRGTYSGSFVNFEHLQVEADRWSLNRDSTFKTININKGMLWNGGRLTGQVLIAQEGALGSNGEIVGQVLNNGRIFAGGVGQTMTITNGLLWNAP